MQKIWLDLTYEESREAKKLGARWDPSAKRWYATPETVGKLKQWVAEGAIQPENIRALPGEDRAFGGTQLFTDLLPQPSSFTTIEAHLSYRQRDTLWAHVLERSNHQCELCGTKENRRGGIRLHLRDRWGYDDEQSRATLRRILLLCTPCYLASRLCVTNEGMEEQSVAQLQKINGWPEQQAREYLRESFYLWRSRSGRSWVISAAILDIPKMGR